MSALALGGSAIVPSLLLLWYVYARDRNPEPRGLLLETFFLGAAICVPVVPVATWLQSAGQELAVGIWGAALVQAFLGAALPEEFFKYLVLRRYVWSKPAFDEPLDGVVYGATASLGFATLENVLYVGEGGLGVAALRAVTAVPSHAFTGIILGAFLGRARFVEDTARRSGLLLAGFGGAVLLHGAYDTFLMTQTGYAVLALGVLALQVLWGRKLYKALQAEQVVAPAVVVAEQLVVAERVLEPAPMLAGGVEPGALSVAVVAEHSLLARAPVSPVAPRRTLGSWLKLWLGGVGLSLCGVWWLLLAVALVVDEPGTPLPAGDTMILVLGSLVPTVLLLLLFRSGLRGPFETAA